jgi:hypothetical protein
LFTICSYLSAAYPKAATMGHDTSYSILLWWRLIHKTASIGGLAGEPWDYTALIAAFGR